MHRGPKGGSMQQEPETGTSTEVVMNSTVSAFDAAHLGGTLSVWRAQRMKHVGLSVHLTSSHVPYSMWRT